MLADHGITDVRVISTEGRLTDHYNPADKTVNLSEAVYCGAQRRRRGRSGPRVRPRRAARHRLQHAASFARPWCRP